MNDETRKKLMHALQRVDAGLDTITEIVCTEGTQEERREYQARLDQVRATVLRARMDLDGPTHREGT